MMRHQTRRFTLAACFGLLVALPAFAGSFLTVNAATVLYDAPSVKGRKLFVIKAETPVEVVVNLEGWSKVRDCEGGLAWLEKKFLADRRSVIVTVPQADVLQKPEEGASVAFTVVKNVSLEYLGQGAGPWVNVRHRDGSTGFIRTNQVWGI